MTVRRPTCATCCCDPMDPDALLPAISGASDATFQITVEHVAEALRSVLDPELGMSVVELGLVYGIEIAGGRVAMALKQNS